MVSSASMGVAERRLGHPFYYTIHQAVCMGMGLIGVILVRLIPLRVWYVLAGSGMALSFLALIGVLIPGIGQTANGSARWLSIGIGHLQVSEFCKLAIVLYLASYIVRHEHAIREKTLGFLRPLGLVLLISMLLLLEPDFGATVIILTTALVVLFLAGVPLSAFLKVVVVLSGGLALLAFVAPYRLGRLTTFLNPWASPFSEGYQLTQALIAFGRGEWVGVGLGSSVQKLFYLPEAHTDFIFAVLAEELGLIGVLVTLLLYVILIYCGMRISLRAEKRHDRFAAFVGYGVVTWIALQTLINMGVNVGLLPTKGLTLPLLSYGGSSMIATVLSIGFLLRIDYENRRALSE